MRLLLPEFEFLSANSSSPNSQPANEHPPADDQPCCSKHLKDGRREGAMQEREVVREERRGKGDEGTEDEIRERKERSSDEKREKEVQSDAEEEEGSSEGEEEDEHMFIRSSGLISHAYSLDLDLGPGEYRNTPCRHEQTTHPDLKHNASMHAGKRAHLNTGW